jgi:hypothetical protein
VSPQSIARFTVANADPSRAERSTHTIFVAVENDATRDLIRLAAQETGGRRGEQPWQRSANFSATSTLKTP